MQQPIQPAHYTHFLLTAARTYRSALLLVAVMIFGIGLNASSLGGLSMTTEETQVQADTTITASICEGFSYLFDGDTLTTSGEYVATYIAADGSDSTVTLQLTVLPVSEVALEATLCEGDEFPFNGANLSQSGTYTAVLTAANGCDSIVTLHLEVLPPTGASLSAGICAGSFYLFEGDTLTQSGVYSAILTNSNGCDSIITLNLEVVDQFVVNQTAAICPGDVYVFAGDTLTAEGTYTDSLKAIGGCDSLIVLQLNILPNSGSELSVTLCEGTPYSFHGETITEEGQFEAVLTAANGCDSTVTLTLTYVSRFETTDTQTICEGESYTFGTQTLDVAGEYQETFTAQGGCDSIVTLTLNVLPRSSGTDQATICFGEALEYHGEVLTDAGVYEFILAGANGCDSVVTFTLEVLPAIGASFEVSICAGDSIDFGDQNLTDAGVYEAIYTAENGCDSIVTLTLEVLPVQETSIAASICAGETYDFNGELLADSGTYTLVFSGENGCDSTVTLVLVVNPVQDTELNVSICAGETYVFDGNPLTDPGTYTAVFQDVNGCDSTVTLVLSVLPNQETNVEATICDNQTYTFDGQELNTSGEYMAVLTGENGCDSTVVLTLNVLPTQASGFAAVICEGEAFTFFGIALTDAGDYAFNFEGENGCDSIVTVSLSVLPVSSSSLEATICDNEAFDYNGESLTAAGVYTFVFDAANGCDSTVTLTLNVLPTQSTLLASSLCVGASYLYEGDTLTASGIYTYQYQGENGCDSTVTLVLEFVDRFETDLEVSVCAGESYIFGQDTLTDAGVYSQLFSAIGSCDSLVNLTLNVLPLTEGSESVSLCAGESYLFNGEELSTSGVYTAVLTGINGCDSTAVLTLTVLPVQTTTLDVTVCANEGYPFNGALLNDSGTYSATLTGENGCDSTVVLNLTVLPVFSETFQVTICSNDSYDFEGGIYTDAGVYEVTYQSENGCDSTLVLELSVLPVATSATEATVCAGESFEYNGTVLTETGVYEFVYPGLGFNGCDSIEVLSLLVLPAVPVTSIAATICEGEVYSYNGEDLTEQGVYTFEFTSAIGCDSIVELNLTVNPTVETSVAAAICEGDSYVFGGQALTDPGTYMAVFQTLAGCDSTVTVTLTVNTVNTGVVAQGNTLIAQAANASYQWVNCANNQLIVGATGNTYTPAQTGNYAVVVTQNGCTATSTCVFIQIVSTKEVIASSDWSIQPNPASQVTHLVFESPLTEELWMEIHDLSGRSLYQKQLPVGAEAAEILLNELPTGVLFVRLSNQDAVSVKRLIKAAE